jgi:hypothetical protein
MNKRPLPVTILCVLGALLAVTAVIRVVLLLTSGRLVVPPSAGQWALAAAAMAAVAAALYGMWRMKRWGVMLVGALLGARIVYGLAAHLPWNPPDLAGPVVLLLVGLLYLRRMT